MNSSTETRSPQKLGFIGVGKIGLPMAKRLIDAGYELHAYDTSKHAVDTIVSAGAHAEASPAAVASVVETVLVSLPTPSVVWEVVSGVNGVVRGDTIRTFIDLSTTGPRVAAEAAKALHERSVMWVDAPVSGGVAGAVAGTLAVMVSCPRERFEQVSRVLGVLGRVFHVGDKPGMGQVMKLANNVLSATAIAATSEVFIMGAKAGLDPRVMVEVLNAGSGRNNATEVKFPKAIIPRTFNLGFSSGLMYKDVKLAVEEGEALGVPMVVANTVRQAWYLAVNQIGGDKDSTTFVQMLERITGVTIGVESDGGRLDAAGTTGEKHR
ncbi:MAG: NAD(P)-dependent oxidoreductase [Burkholderiales bacterium]